MIFKKNTIKTIVKGESVNFIFSKMLKVQLKVIFHQIVHNNLFTSFVIHLVPNCEFDRIKKKRDLSNFFMILTNDQTMKNLMSWCEILLCNA